MVLGCCLVGLNPPVINERRFLREYEQRPLHWNLGMLGKLKLKKVKKAALDQQQMIDVVDKASNTLTQMGRDNASKLINEEERGIIVDYIPMHHNPEMEYKRWWMNNESIPLTINLLGSILEHLNQAIDSNKLDSLPYSLESIAESMKFCPDRQIAALKDAYAMIQCDYQSNELSNFIKNRIIALKEHKFRLLMAPAISPQNAHVLNTG